MLKDLTGDDWRAILGLGDQPAPDALILRGTRNLRSRYDEHRRLFSDVVEVGSPNGLFEDVLIGRFQGRAVAYASVYGPAMASEIVHVFGAMGTKVVIQTGVCGGIANAMDAGDLVVATAAGRGDGASDCYLPAGQSVDATPELVKAAMALAAGVPVHRGPIWTTSALLAEGDVEINAWHDQGYIAVDMETATTFAVAEYFGMRRVSVLSVFDNPRHGAHLGMSEADKDHARDLGNRAALDIVLALAVNAAHG